MHHSSKQKVSLVGIDQDTLALAKFAALGEYEIVALVELSRHSYARQCLYLCGMTEVPLGTTMDSALEGDVIALGALASLRPAERQHRINYVQNWCQRNSKSLIVMASPPFSGSISDRSNSRTGPTRQTSVQRRAIRATIPTVAFCPVSWQAPAFYAHVSAASALQNQGFCTAGLTSSPYGDLIGVPVNQFADRNGTLAFDSECFMQTDLILDDVSAGADLLLCSCDLPLYVDADQREDSIRSLYTISCVHAAIGWLMAVRPDRIILVSHSSDPYKRIKRTRSIVQAVTGHDVTGVIHDGELLYADFQGPESYVGSFPMKREDYAGLENWIKSKAMTPVHSMHETPASMLSEILA